MATDRTITLDLFRRINGMFFLNFINFGVFSLENLPNDEISVPVEIQTNELTELVNLSAKSVDGKIDFNPTF